MLSNTNSGNMSRSEIIHPVIVDLILLDRRKIKYGPVQVRQISIFAYADMKQYII